MVGAEPFTGTKRQAKLSSKHWHTYGGTTRNQILSAVINVSTDYFIWEVFAVEEREGEDILYTSWKWRNKKPYPSLWFFLPLPSFFLLLFLSISLSSFIPFLLLFLFPCSFHPLPSFSSSSLINKYLRLMSLLPRLKIISSKPRN